MRQRGDEPVSSHRIVETRDADDANAGRVLFRFSDPALEAAFRQDYAGKSLRQVRFSLALGCFLYAIFGVLDPRIIPDAAELAWRLRYSVVCPYIMVILLLSYRAGFERIMQYTVASVGLIAGFGIVAMIADAAPPGCYLYYAGLLLACTFINTFMRLRFAAASLVTWSIVLLYEAVAFDRSPTSILMNNSFFLLATNFVGVSACYFMERHARTEFLQQRIIQEQASQLHDVLQGVECARRQAEDRSRRDALTDLFNRRHFYEILRSELDDKRHGDPTAVLLVDVDNFKSINDRYGHAAGDQVLNAVAAQMCKILRASDVACRYGGDEFAVLLPGSDHQAALDVGERLRASIAAMSVATAKGDIPVTVSLGVAGVFADEHVDSNALLDRSDQALYAAKGAGRNQVIVWPVADPTDETSGTAWAST